MSLIPTGMQPTTEINAGRLSEAFLLMAVSRCDRLIEAHSGPEVGIKVRQGQFLDP